MAELSIDPDYLRRLIVKVRAFMAKEETDIPDDGSNPVDDALTLGACKTRRTTSAARRWWRRSTGSSPPAGRTRGSDVARPRRRRARGVERACRARHRAPRGADRELSARPPAASPITDSTAWSGSALAASSPTTIASKGGPARNAGPPLSTTCRRRLSPRTAGKAAGSALELAPGMPLGVEGLGVAVPPAGRCGMPPPIGLGRPRRRCRPQSRLRRRTRARLAALRGCRHCGRSGLRRCIAGFGAATLPRLPASSLQPASWPLPVLPLACAPPASSPRLRAVPCARAAFRRQASLPPSRCAVVLRAAVSAGGSSSAPGPSSWRWSSSLPARAALARRGGLFRELVFLLVVRFFPLVFVAMVLLRFSI